MGVVIELVGGPHCGVVRAVPMLKQELELAYDVGGNAQPKVLYRRLVGVPAAVGADGEIRYAYVGQVGQPPTNV